MNDEDDDAEPAPTGDTPEAEALLDAMHDYSGEFFAGWLCDMEFYLWSSVMCDKRWPEAEDEDARRRAPLLDQLSRMAGGWWYYDDEKGRTFESLADWEKRYAAHEVTR